MKKLLLQSASAFTLIELMIAMALFMTVMVIATGLFSRAADNQGKAVAIKNLQEGFDYSLNFIKKEAEGAKPLNGCGTGCTGNTYFCLSTSTLFLRNKNDQCVKYFLNTDSTGVQRLAVTRDGLPASPYFTYLTSPDIQMTALNFSTAGLTSLPSARLTIFMAARPVTGTTVDTLNLETSLAIRPFVCGQTIYDRDNFAYKTILIGNQCWMAENLRSRTKPNTTCINPGAVVYIPPTPTHTYTLSPAPDCVISDNGVVTTRGGYTTSGRDCVQASGSIIRGNESDCINGYALYRWNDAMNGTTVTNQGICPQGWHIPTPTDRTTLTTYLGGATTAGAALKLSGTSGFNAVYTGDRELDGNTFLYRDDSGGLQDWDCFWTTGNSGASADYFCVYSGDSQVYSISDNKNFNIAIRCIKD